MGKVKSFIARNMDMLRTLTITAMTCMMIACAGAAEGDAFDMAATMGAATDSVVSVLQTTAAAVIPKGLVVLGIIVALRFGKTLIRSATGGR